MKIKNLIELLNGLDPEMDVLQYSEDDDRFYIPHDIHILDQRTPTRDFAAVTPKGTTQKFLCL